jgi:hypothetical protein
MMDNRAKARGPAARQKPNQKLEDPQKQEATWPEIRNPRRVFVQLHNNWRLVFSTSPELQHPQLVVDAAIFLHPKRLLLSSRRTAAGASRSMEPFLLPVSQNPRDVGSNSRVWMNYVPIRHVPGGVRPPARHRQQGTVSPSYPVWGFRLDSPPCRSSTTWCGQALRLIFGQEVVMSTTS